MNPAVSLAAHCLLDRRNFLAHLVSGLGGISLVSLFVEQDCPSV
jgi:hypothetical protein